MLWRTNNISHLSHLNTLFSQRRRTAASPLATWNSWFLCLFIYNPSWSPADLWTNKFISFFPLNTRFFSLRMRTAASPPAAWNSWFLCLRTAAGPAAWHSWFEWFLCLRTAAGPAAWHSWFLCLFHHNPSWSPASSRLRLYFADVTEGHWSQRLLMTLRQTKWLGF